MAIIKKRKSKKAVDVSYWHISSFSYSRSGNLTIRIKGYKDGRTYSKGADPIDEYEAVFFDADSSIKSGFYELLKKHIDIFDGSTDELSYSSRRRGPSTVIVQDNDGAPIMQKKLIAAQDNTAHSEEINEPFTPPEEPADPEEAGTGETPPEAKIPPEGLAEIEET
jgi:hypothetical protein